mgnify:CR=1 FL=1
MKIKDVHIKILENFLYFNDKFGYDGNKLLKTRNTDKTVYIEAYIPDFIDLPLYTKDLTDILKFITPETEISMTNQGDVNYMHLNNGNGVVKYRLSNEVLVTKDVEHKVQFDLINYNENHFKFNLDTKTYDNIMKISKMLECNLIDIYSIDEKKIGIKTYKESDVNGKQYTIEIEVNHDHHDKIYTFMLNQLQFVKASDYLIDIGIKIISNGSIRPMMKVKAFCNNIEVKYVFLAKKIN